MACAHGPLPSWLSTSIRYICSISAALLRKSLDPPLPCNCRVDEEAPMTRSDGYLTTTDGTRLYFERLGTGEPTVVIPNGSYLVDDFSRLAERRTLIVYDPRNRGRSD